MHRLGLGPCLADDMGLGKTLQVLAFLMALKNDASAEGRSQATDRAFRIGQKKNVLVHKFLCVGTFEEKIDAMIERKTGMAGEILADSAEAILTTEMSDRQHENHL